MKNLRRMLRKDPGKWIGALGTLVSLAVVFTKLTAEQGAEIQKILDAVLVLVVGGTAAGIRSQAFAPDTVVERVAEGASLAAKGVARNLGGAAAGAVGELTSTGITIAEQTADVAVETVTGVAGTVVGAVGGLLR